MSSIKTAYDQLLKGYLELKETQKQIVIFGAKEMAYIGKAVIEHCGRPVSWVCDNNPDLIGMNFHGQPISTIQDIVAHAESCIIYICSFNKTSILQISSQLKLLGFDDIRNSDMLYWSYHVNVLKRPVDPVLFAQTVTEQYELGKNEEPPIKISTVDLQITEKCTLKCKDCSLFIPYYQKPTHLPLDVIQKSIAALSEFADTIQSVSVMGGEPFLHDDLVAICQTVSEKANILKINLVTNGTVVPSREMLTALKPHLTTVCISDYGALSSKINDLKALLEQLGIAYVVFSEDLTWYKNTSISDHHRSLQTLKEIYSSCFWNSKILLHRGELHLCQISAIGRIFDLFDNRGDFIDLLSWEGAETLVEKRTALRNFLNQDHTRACNYCDIWRQLETVKAEQTTSQLYFDGVTYEK